MNVKISPKVLCVIIGFMACWIVNPLAAHASFDCHTYTELPVVECEAVVMLMDAAAETNTPCDWYPTYCKNGTVVELTLDHYGLTNLPPEIGQLQNLELLYLWNNGLTSLPDEIGLLSSLEVLDLDNNLLTALPNSISGLVKLEELYLHHNQLKLLPTEIGRLQSLTELNLSSNQLESLPDEVTTLSKLKVVDLQENSIVCGSSIQLRSWVEEYKGICVDDTASAISVHTISAQHLNTKWILLTTVPMLSLSTFRLIRRNRASTNS